MDAALFLLSFCYVREGLLYPAHVSVVGGKELVEGTRAALLIIVLQTAALAYLFIMICRRREERSSIITTLKLCVLCFRCSGSVSSVHIADLRGITKPC